MSEFYSSQEMHLTPKDVPRSPEKKEILKPFLIMTAALGLLAGVADQLRAHAPEASSKKSSQEIRLSSEELREMREHAQTAGRLLQLLEGLTHAPEAEPSKRVRDFQSLDIAPEDFLFLPEETSDPEQKRNLHWFTNFDFVQESLDSTVNAMEMVVEDDYLSLQAKGVEIESPISSFDSGFAIDLDLSYQLEELEEEGVLTLTRTNNDWETTTVIVSTDHADGFEQDELHDAIRRDFQKELINITVTAELKWETRMNHPEEE